MELAIRRKAEEMIAERLAQEVVKMISKELIGTDDDLESHLIDFFVDNLKISI